MQGTVVKIIVVGFIVPCFIIAAIFVPSFKAKFDRYINEFMPNYKKTETPQQTHKQQPQNIATTQVGKRERFFRKSRQVRPARDWTPRSPVRDGIAKLEAEKKQTALTNLTVPEAKVLLDTRLDETLKSLSAVQDRVSEESLQAYEKVAAYSRSILENYSDSNSVSQIMELIEQIERAYSEAIATAEGKEPEDSSQQQ